MYHSIVFRDIEKDIDFCEIEYIEKDMDFCLLL